MMIKIRFFYNLLFYVIYIEFFIYKYFMETIFTNIYENKVWGGGSGQGSTIGYNKNTYVLFLKKFIIDHDIKTVVDLGCGDFQCGKITYDDLDIKYVGYDTYKKIIDQHLQIYIHPKYSFIHLDFCDKKDSIINGDLCILKDVLQHWKNSDIHNFLDYIIKNNKFKYILVYNCCNQTQDNVDINIGD